MATRLVKKQLNSLQEEEEGKENGLKKTLAKRRAVKLRRKAQKARSKQQDPKEVTARNLEYFRSTVGTQQATLEMMNKVRCAPRFPVVAAFPRRWRRRRQMEGSICEARADDVLRTCLHRTRLTFICPDVTCAAAGW